MDLFTVGFVAVSIIFLILLPGLALSMAIFPKKEQLDIVERVGVSFLLGLTPQFLLYFGNKNSLIPIDTMTNYLAIAGVTVIGILVWQHRTGKKIKIKFK